MADPQVPQHGDQRPAPGSPGGSPRPGAHEWIRSALAYVPSVARRFLGCGLAFEDLVAAGNLGLVAAALRYDPSRRVKFITYADFWIRKTILRAIQEEVNAVRLPRYRADQVRELVRHRRDLSRRLGREPDIAELAEATGRSPGEIRTLLSYRTGSVSLDEAGNRDGDRAMMNTLRQPEGTGPSEIVEREDFRRHLRGWVERLDERERSILVLRYGLDGEGPRTLRAVGARLGLSRERVRQLERRALRHLRDVLGGT